MKERLVLVLESLAKCVFTAKSIEFMGYVLSADGRRPRVAKLQAIKVSVHKDEHEISRFMGLASFFRRFVRKFTEKARLSTELTKKNVPFKWGDNKRNAFVSIKENLLYKPVLKLFDFTKEIKLHTDQGLVGMLLQRDDNRNLHLVYCFSKKISDAKSKYHSSKIN